LVKLGDVIKFVILALIIIILLKLFTQLKPIELEKCPEAKFGEGSVKIEFVYDDDCPDCEDIWGKIKEINSTLHKCIDVERYHAKKCYPMVMKYKVDKAPFIAVGGLYLHYYEEFEHNKLNQTMEKVKEEVKKVCLRMP